MAIRIPRGYDVSRPPYVELCEGVRPNVQALPLEAWTGLPPVRVDEVHHDPIVLDAGTVVGVVTGSVPSNSTGKLFPAIALSGAATITLKHHSDGASWGLPTTDSSLTSMTSVKPIGVVYQPIYSFMLQQTFTNYKRNDNVGVVTDYVVQIPAITTAEHSIAAGDLVMVEHKDNAANYGVLSTSEKQAGFPGRYRKYDATLSIAQGSPIEYVVGRCLKSFVFATGSNNTVFKSDTVTLTSEAKKEFSGLDRVQTVPGLALSGSGTSGVPAHLAEAISDGSGNYRALTLLIRL